MICYVIVTRTISFGAERASVVTSKNLHGTFVQRELLE
jgi:hypothetical protein